MISNVGSEVARASRPALPAAIARRLEGLVVLLSARRSGALALGVGLVALTAWRAACVLAGPDVDTDAYAHHMIARAILADPRDLAVHWVWLPLFHYLQVPLVAAGGSMNAVRWFNVAASTALPVVLYAYVRRTAR